MHFHTPGHSVHFEECECGQLLLHPGDENPDDENECAENSSSSVNSKSQSTDPSEIVNDTSKRNLDKWHYVEHMEPKILLQV